MKIQRCKCLVNTKDESELPSQTATVFTWSSKKHPVLCYPDGRLCILCWLFLDAFHRVLLSAALTGSSAFFNYILLIMLLQLSQFLLLCPPPPNIPFSLRQSPHHCSCPWVMPVSLLATPFPIVYLTSLWLFCNYLFVLLNPLTVLTLPHTPSPICQPSKCSPYPWFCLSSSWLLSLFFRFQLFIDMRVLSFYCS